jgi:GNAT superfamily N-acetyltransferase
MAGMNEHNRDGLLNQKHFEGYVERSLNGDLSSLQSTYFSNDKPSGGFWVAVENQTNTIQGMIGCQRLDESTCELRRMSVVKQHLRKGVAKMLLEKFLDHARLQGFSKVYLNCWPHQKEAISLYCKHGFEITQERQVGNYGVKIVDLWKTLS